MSNTANYRFKPNRQYVARYEFPSKINASGDIVNMGVVTTEFNGAMILKHGLKNTVRFNAERLSIPKGYSCVVDDE